MDFVVDCSAIFGIFFHDETNGYTQKVYEFFQRGKKAVVPSVFPLEVGNTVYQQKKRTRWENQEIEDFLNLLSKLPIHIEYQDISSIDAIHTLSQKFNLSSYDASYLYVAKSHNIPLATQDKNLKKAAKALGLFFE